VKKLPDHDTRNDSIGGSIADAYEPTSAPWSLRSQQIGAKPFDPAQGVERFFQLWGNDRYVASLTQDEKARFARYLHFVRVPADKEIISQNEQGDFMVIVLEGTLLVDRVQALGARVRLAEVHAGEMLGEMSLLDSGTRFSTCSTSMACTLAVVDTLRLNEMTASDPRIALALMASLSRRLSLRLRQVSSRLSALLAGG
jgi:CRP/FNR family cyclic AMP-dependent transcriptional regulator